ncbi:MAG TPA: iron-sulfur cluster repair di-iron protein [Fluviicola sp.]|nr:iron-sulfur cluster repair di-iron protein [Fluviicola sp.]
MEITKENNIGELVALDYRTAPVFKKFGIDFCCNGNRSIEDACSKKNIDPTSVVKSLQEATTTSTGTNTDYNSWPLDLLADYIEKKHHRYVETKIMEIQPFLAKIVRVHGEKHPELAEIEKLFNESAGELTKHMKKEELILFPFIRKMVAAKQKGESIPTPHFGSVENPIDMMNHEHTIEGERFRQIAELSNNYTPPADGCNTYRVTFAMIQEFEDDLHLHIHLENNILFPKAIEMERAS